MPEPKPKRKRLHKTPVKPYDALAAMDCEVVAFDFDVDTDTFDLVRFLKQTSLPSDYRSWSAIFYAKQQSVGYHVHLDGRIRGKGINISVRYYGRSFKVPTGAKEPFAETAMAWIGSFFKQPKAAVWVTANLSKPNTKWNSRFNLPFKVTMTGSKTEVVIDGISMDLPYNEFGAFHAFMNKLSSELSISLMLRRTVEFSKFRVLDELPVYNEAVKMFIEERRS